MNILAVIFLVIAVINILVGIVAKFTVGILFNAKPVSYLIFANTFLLLAVLMKVWQ